MPLPDPDLVFSDFTVRGDPIADAAFPRYRARRVPPQSEPNAPFHFDKRAEDHLDYSCDLTMILDPGEALIAAYAWTTDPEVLVCTACRFADRGLMALVLGGVDGANYRLNMICETTTLRVIQISCEIGVTGDAALALAGTVDPALDIQAKPSRAYLRDVLNAVLLPVYGDVLGDPLSEPL